VDFFNPVTPGTSGNVRFTLPSALAADAKIAVAISNSSETSPTADASRDTSQPPPGGGQQPPPGGGQAQPGAPNLAVSITGAANSIDGSTIASLFSGAEYTVTVTNVGTAPSGGARVIVLGQGEGGGLGPLFGMTSRLFAAPVTQPPHQAAQCIDRVLESGSAFLAQIGVPGLNPGQSFGGRVAIQEDRTCAVDELRRPVGVVKVSAQLSPEDGPPGPDRADTQTTFDLPSQALPDTNQTKQPATQPAKDLKQLDGTSAGDVQQVQVGVLQLVDGAKPRAAAAGCRSLSSPRGRFTRVPLTNGRCNSVRWLRAKGTKKWSFKLRKALPKGRYAIYSRAVGKDGVPEAKFSARDRNQQVVKLR
jgi:hypothetical protein